MIPMSLPGFFLAGVAACAPAAALAATPAPAESGRLLLEARTRLETLDQGQAEGQALTSRVRLGWETPTIGRFTGLVEAEAVAVLIDDYADGVDPKPGRATIPDPENLELNRAQVTWSVSPAAEVVFGRQRIVLGNARHVGNSGWRQNEQTFDAVKLVARPSARTSLTYAYVGRVNRTIGRDHSQGVWRGDIHLAQADLKSAGGQVTGYAYLLDFDTARAQSSATYGLRWSGERPVAKRLSATWELEYARQTDWGSNPDEFDLDYVLVVGGVRTATSSVGLVFERLDGDGRRGFQTPLASAHGFQGWSDVIGATPAYGVSDIYLRANKTFQAPRPIRLAGELHDFRDADAAFRLGREVDVSAAVSLSKPLSLEAGVARFDSTAPSYPDATRAWLSLDWKY
jgi:hypothetical protein